VRQAVIIIALSVAIHLLLWVVFASFAARQQPVAHKTVPPTVLQVQVEPSPQPRRILEAEQTETAPPPEARYLGRTNHRAKVETKTPARRTRPAVAAKLAPRKSIVAPRPAAHKAAVPKLTYAQFLQESQHSLASSGYQDFLPDNLARGGAIDISTSEYRYIGYFSGLRKAIELAWNYPSQAVRRGQQGVVSLRFAIAADGTASKIKVTQSSGHRLLDVAIVDAIRLASPFSPLPAGFKREQLTITGSFHYILRGI